jgi:hypothetical protein
VLLIGFQADIFWVYFQSVLFYFPAWHFVSLVVCMIEIRFEFRLLR